MSKRDRVRFLGKISDTGSASIPGSSTLLAILREHSRRDMYVSDLVAGVGLWVAPSPNRGTPGSVPGPCLLAEIYINVVALT